MQICEAHDAYLRAINVTRDLSPHTLRAYRSDLGVLARFVGEREPVDNFDVPCLVAFLNDQRALGHSASTLRRRVSALRSCFSWLLEEGHISLSPWNELKLEFRRGRPIPRAIPSRDVRRLLRHLVGAAEGTGKASERNTLLAVALMLGTGVRVGEVAAITTRDIDSPGRRILIHGKGRRERQVFLTTPWFADEFERHRLLRQALGLDHDYLLFNQNGRPLTTASIRTRLADASVAARTSVRITPHMLRHTAATELLEAGVDIRYVQKLLGHASISTTELYTHVSDRVLQRVVSKADVVGRAFRKDGARR